ncbi:hypothetical protein [Coleofasciculus sp. LEGE 07092]|uniref:hypothetical protein n=1 Tax=Coleofasciculus sp. LEGE 07092 TaxID=2777969 RepID=UPI0018814AE0|nr:hypothetical protein [Coleofasciculus sp. LEGE 07092]MBE9151382.1 hypothetical protein [Coleofasciculus sp. LEGE 07092]
MTNITISNLDSDDSNLFSQLDEEETETITGGMFPSEPGSGFPPPPPPPPLIISPLPPPTGPIGPTLPLGC